LARKLWSWARGGDQGPATQALALRVLGRARGRAIGIFLSVSSAADWIEQLEDAGDSSQLLYVRGHATEALFASNALDSQGDGEDATATQLRAWALAVNLLQDDDADVRETARQGLASILMGYFLDSSALSVLEETWAHMTIIFGQHSQYAGLLWRIISTGPHADEEPQDDAQTERLWDSNDEEGDNIFADRVLQHQLAVLQLRRLDDRMADGAGPLFLLADDAEAATPATSDREPSDAQLTALQIRMESLHAAGLVSEKALFAVEDDIADYISDSDLSITKLIDLSEAATDDGAFATAVLRLCE
jgi:hypothetical protein